jgi:hypothetical protein
MEETGEMGGREGEKKRQTRRRGGTEGREEVKGEGDGKKRTEGKG